MKIRASFLAVVALFAVGCSEPAKEQPAAAAPAAASSSPHPILVALSPASTVAGQSFNVQPDGRSALGVQGKDSSGTAVIVFGSRPLDTAHGPNFALSAIVPADLYATAGNVPVFIRDANGESNRIDFVVKPTK